MGDHTEVVVVGILDTAPQGIPAYVSLVNKLPLFLYLSVPPCGVVTVPWLPVEG
jgi:hypothetical protein